MQFRLVFQILGLLLVMYSLALVPPVLLSLFYGDGEIGHLSLSMLVTFLLGLLLWLPLRRRIVTLRSRDGFFIVTMFWTVLGVLSALPFVLGLGLSIPDAVFESISAFTTTGATVITGLDLLPKSILFYRQELQWLGGIGVVVSAVAVLPMLGIGGMQLFKAETPGPMKDEKLTPRIAHTARWLWIVYGILTAGCALGYWWAGMGMFDAVAHSMSTVSTGGFSTHDASLAFFNSTKVDAVADVFMLLGGISFSIHFLALRQQRPMAYWQNPEVRAFLLIVASMIAISTAVLFFTQRHPALNDAFEAASFQVISVITSTGFTTEDFSAWPLALPLFLMLSSFVGGCAGSTAGGMKVVRFLVLGKQGARELMQLIHPRSVRLLKLGGRVVSERIVESVWGFFVAYIGIFIVMLLLLMADGMDQVSAFGAVATCINNLGPGLGEVSSNFVHASDRALVILSAAMLIGRLEIFTVAVLFTRTFWRN